MSEETKQLTLEELLSKHSVKRINSSEEIINNIFDYQHLINHNEVLTCKSDKQFSLIMFDTNIFNSCYVIDEFNKFMDIPAEELLGASKINETKNKVNVFYCDDVEIYKTIFSKYFNNKYKHEINEDRIVPIILIVNHFENDILIEEERFAPFNPSTFLSLYTAI